MNPFPRNPLITGALALALALVPGLATAQKGDVTRDRTQTQERMTAPDRLQDRDQDRDRDRLRLDAAAAQDRLQTRLQEMDRTRDRLHQASGAADREQLRTQYRDQIRQCMDDLRIAGAGPGPKATLQQRLQHMERQLQQTQDMLRHTWEYQNREGQPN